MTEKITPQAHHVRMEVAKDRPLYRRGRRDTAVKVFTINDESVHLLVFGVPAIRLQEQLAATCAKFGDVTLLCVIPDYPTEEFTEVYHVVFTRLSSARFAKRRMDGLEFYGGILHVCYAPELETVDETRDKLAQRSKLVCVKIKNKK